MMDDMDMGMDVGMDGMMIMMVLSLVVGLAVVTLAVVGVVWLARRTDVGGGSRSESPEEILMRRYAAGEIDDDEFQRRRARLQ